jgi:hypothetical protein
MPDFGIGVPPHRQWIEGIEDNIAPISIEEALLIAGVRVCEHHPITARQGSGEQLTNGG